MPENGDKAFISSKGAEASKIAVVPQVLPLWVAQLQMEMLATDTASAIIVSRSATQVGLCACFSSS